MDERIRKQCFSPTLVDHDEVRLKMENSGRGKLFVGRAFARGKSTFC
jgi:hypothetical protein